MIKAVFAVKGEKFIGFTVKGHSGYAESGNDIICAGVSSALMLTVNTITDFSVWPQTWTFVRIMKATQSSGLKFLMWMMPAQ